MPKKYSRNKFQKGADKAIVVNPPQRNLTVGGDYVFRFQVTSDRIASQINVAQLLSMLLISNSNVSASYFRLIQSLLIKKVEIFAQPTLAETIPIACGVQWGGTTQTYQYLSDIHVANTATYVVSKPPKNSYAEFWLSQGVSESVGLMFLDAPEGAIIDLHVKMAIVSDFTGSMSNYTATVTAPAAGMMFFNAMDGTNNHIIPVAGLSAIH
jgi:hypothetical protein